MTAQSPSSSQPLPSPINRLLHAKEALPPEVRTAVLALGDAAIPHLVAILDDDAHCDVDAPGAGFAPVHALEMLGELKAVAAIEPMLRLLADTTPDDIVHDLVVRRLPDLGEAALEPVLARLALLTGEEAEDDDARAPLYAILARLGVKDDRVFAALVTLEAKDPGLAAMYFADYGDARALPRLRRLILEQTPDYASEHFHTDFRELLHDFERLGGLIEGDLRARVDAVWAGLREHTAAAKLAGGKTGRNDPCPCGSGKKFKKCCINGGPGNPALAPPAAKRTT